MTLQSTIRSKMMGLMSSEGLANFRRGKAHYLRKFRLEAPKVYYFHQVDDPYSHLVVQKLAALQEQYNIDFAPCLVPDVEDAFKGDASKFDTWALADAANIASYFGCEFTPVNRPNAEEVATANAQLLNSLDADLAAFTERAIDIGQRLWAGDRPNSEIPERLPGRVQTALRKGAQLRTRLGHYLGATFYFEGEWFWGLDRLHLLERRLIEEGYGTGPLVCPLPRTSSFVLETKLPSKEIVLEYFPSLRSPYSAIGHKRVLDLVAQTDVTLSLRPVMPMMMRGVPAPSVKQQYIMSDAGRESRFYGDTFGPFRDPFGEPVKRAFAAYHHCQRDDLGLRFVTEYLAAAFAEGLAIDTDAGLAEVCLRAGFAYSDVNLQSDWHAELDENLQAMAANSLWGVPSFRVTGGNSETDFACWGQDRIWRVAAEISKRSQ